jgi:hypothetical protein
MSTSAMPERRRSAIDTVAGLLAAGSIALACIALVHNPFRIGPVAIGLAILAAAMSTRHSRLAYAAVVISTVGWFFGMIVAMVTNNAVY